MSMCSQMSASLNLTINNNDVKNACTSVVLSKRYMKNLIRIALLNILYRRMPLSEDEFKSKEFESIPFVVFKRNSKNPLIRKYHGWTAALIDAIDKNYLKDLHLMFKENEDIKEYYKFTIKYSEKQENFVDKFGELTDETKYFFLMLKNLGKHPKLCTDNEPIVEFTYYHETPEDYQPPQFGPSTDGYCLKMSGDLKTLAKIHTGYQSLAWRASGETFKNRALSVSSVGVSNKTDIEIDEEDGISVSLRTITPVKSPCKKNEPNNNEILDEGNNKQKKSKILNVSGITIEDGIIKKRFLCENDDFFVDSRYGLSDVTSDSASVKTTQVLDCICKTQYEDSVIDTVTCNQCYRNVHLPCFGFLDKSTLLTPAFQCFQCNGEKYVNDRCLQVKSDNLTTLALLRLFMTILYKEGSIGNFVKNLNSEERKYLNDRMLNWSIYSKSDDPTQNLSMNREMLEEVLPKLLKTNDSLELR